MSEEDVAISTEVNFGAALELDWRQLGAVTPIKNQKWCAACYTFSANAALEGLYYIKTGNLISFSN